MRTEIFNSYEEFQNRPDKRVNGISMEFVRILIDGHYYLNEELVIAQLKDQNTKNTGCWNCAWCKYCFNCQFCFDCTLCTNAHKCEYLNECQDISGYIYDNQTPIHISTGTRLTHYDLLHINIHFFEGCVSAL